MLNSRIIMDRKRWRAISPYLGQVLELPAEEVEGWLQRLQASEPAIAADVRRLLGVRERARFSSFLSGQAPAPSVIQLLRAWLAMACR